MSLAKGFNDYRKAVENWWDDLLRMADALYLEFRPVYFVSSNPHSLPNLLSGHALAQREALADFVRQENPEGLAEEWQRLVADGDPAKQANFLYYIQRLYLKGDDVRQAALAEAESDRGRPSLR